MLSKHNLRRILTGLALAAAMLSACQTALDDGSAAAASAAAASAAPSVTPAPTASPAPPSPTALPSPTLTQTPTFTPLPSDTPTPEPTLPPSATPTYAILRGEVMVRSNCRYGPGWMYLYKYGLVVGSNLEIYGRTERGDWLLVRAIGGNNQCWVRADLMQPKGEVMAVQPTYIPLPQSPYYGPVQNVAAWRSGSSVTVSWSQFVLRPGDDHASPVHLVEAWVCRDGKLEFTPVGTNDTTVDLIDEPGCLEASHGRVYGVEKHGYTNWIEIPWPPAEPDGP